MDLSLMRICRMLGVPPKLWMLRNPFKIYEFVRIVEGAHLEPHHTALDLGCGQGMFTMMLAEQCQHVIGIDVSKSQIEVAQKFSRNSRRRDHVQFLCTSLEQANLPENSLDRVFSFCVLEHIPNLDVVLAEVFRLLKPGGELHVSVDSLGTVTDLALREKHSRDHQVVRYFTTETLQQQFQQTGLEAIKILPIMTGDFARREFEKRILRPYRHNLFNRLRLYQQFLRDDMLAPGPEGIMLVGRARRP